MSTEQAYINGFVKRAAEYGYNEDEAAALYKEAGASWRTAGSSVRKKLYEKLNPAQFKKLTNITHPYGVEAGRRELLGKALRNPDNSQASRVREGLKELLNARQKGMVVDIRPNSLDVDPKPYSLIEKLIGANKHVELTPRMLKEKMLEAGGLYNKPRLP
jgi:hypothetical protein